LYSGFSFSGSGTSFGHHARLEVTASTSSEDHGTNLCQPSVSLCLYGGAEIQYSGSNITLYSDLGTSTETDFSGGYTFTAADYVNSTREGAGTTLSAVVHNWSSNDVANGVTRKMSYIVPDNFSKQVFLYWDNTHRSNPTSYEFNVAVLPLEITAFASLPASGTATYNGAAELMYDVNGDNTYAGDGTATFNVDWAAKTISGNFGAMQLECIYAGCNSTVTFPAMTMAATAIVDRNTVAEFSGNLVYNGYDNFSLYNELTGMFFGSGYEEIGGAFSVTASSGNDGAGYFAAKR
jgi:hypothetical protein